LSKVIHFPFWLGDCLMSFPFAHGLAQQNPDEKIIAVVDPSLVALVEKLNSKFVIWPFSKNQRNELYLALKKERPSSCYLLTNSFGSYLPYIKAGIRNRIGHGGRFTRLFLTQSHFHSNKELSQGVMNLGLLSSEPYEPLTNILQTKINHTGKPHLLVFPGAKYGPAKKWNIQSYAEVIDAAIDKKWKISLMGTPDEKQDAEEILKVVKDDKQVENLCGSLKMAELINWLEEHENLIALANDSGAFHLLSSCGIPSLGLYFSTSSTATPPAFGPFEVLNADIECKPCFARECPLKHYNCRDTVTSESVSQKLFLLSDKIFNK
jgi:heptosyltransferase II